MNISDETYQISTPENVDFGYEVAGIGSRFLAALLDTLLITILQGAALLALIFIFSLVTTGPLPETNTAMSWGLALYALMAFGFLWGYYIFFETLWNGQTPGKRKARLRVIRSDGMPIGFSEAAIRNLVRLIDFLPAYYGVGVVTMFIDNRSRRLGDMAAGTLVVRDRGTITLESLEKEQNALAFTPAVSQSASVAGIDDLGQALPPSPMAATEWAGTERAATETAAPVAGIDDPGQAFQPSPMAATERAATSPILASTSQEAEKPEWPVELLTGTDLRIAEDFLRRRDEFVNRAQLGRQIARRLQDRMGMSQEEMMWVNAEELLIEEFLIKVIRYRQAR